MAEEKEDKSLLERIAEMNMAFHRAFASVPCERTGFHMWESGRKCHWCGRKKTMNDLNDKCPWRHPIAGPT